MNHKMPTFYNNQRLFIKEICNHIKDIVLILKTQKDKIEIRRIRKSLENYENR